MSTFMHAILYSPTPYISDYFKPFLIIVNGWGVHEMRFQEDTLAQLSLTFIRTCAAT